MKYIQTFENFNMDKNLNVNFLRWFGESKVVDNKGEPLVVYHGSTANNTIEVFDNLSDGIYFSNDIDVAKGYGSQIKECYLKIENPIILDAEGRDWFYFEGQHNNITKAIEEASLNNNDGVIIKEMNDPKDHDYDDDESNYYDEYNPSDVYIVFNPNQIKSIHNKGTWDSNKNSINENNISSKTIDINEIKIEDNKEIVLVDTSNVNAIVSASREGKIPLDKLRVETMAKKIKNGEKLPPIKLFNNSVLKDGYHRYAAHKLINKKDIDVLYI